MNCAANRSTRHNIRNSLNSWGARTLRRMLSQANNLWQCERCAEQEKRKRGMGFLLDDFESHCACRLFVASRMAAFRTCSHAIIPQSPRLDLHTPRCTTLQSGLKIVKLESLKNSFQLTASNLLSSRSVLA
jgi:hypothetical protein